MPAGCNALCWCRPRLSACWRPTPEHRRSPRQPRLRRRCCLPGLLRRLATWSSCCRAPAAQTRTPLVSRPRCGPRVVVRSSSTTGARGRATSCVHRTTRCASARALAPSSAGGPTSHARCTWWASAWAPLSPTPSPRATRPPRARAYVETKVAQTSARWHSGGCPDRAPGCPELRPASANHQLGFCLAGEIGLVFPIGAGRANVHLTLCDAFTARGLAGLARPTTAYGVANFGSSADYCESILNTDDPVPHTRMGKVPPMQRTLVSDPARLLHACLLGMRLAAQCSSALRGCGSDHWDRSHGLLYTRASSGWANGQAPRLALPRARPLCLLRARLAALGSSALPGREVGH